MLLPAFWPDVGTAPQHSRQTLGKLREVPQTLFRLPVTFVSCLPSGEITRAEKAHILLEEDDPLLADGNRGHIPSIQPPPVT